MRGTRSGMEGDEEEWMEDTVGGKSRGRGRVGEGGRAGGGVG